MPAPGGTHLMIVTFPPDSLMMRPEFDLMAYGAELGATLPGLVDTFEPDSPGMHTTDSVDYDVVSTVKSCSNPTTAKPSS
jgi:hypothetical protein